MNLHQVAWSNFAMELKLAGGESSNPFNNACPKVHNGGANVTLLDGHVERVSFKKLWQINSGGKVVHSFWYMED